MGKCRIMHMKKDAAHIYYLKVALRGTLLNNKYARIHFHVHICNTSPLPPPSLKGKGTSTQALCRTLCAHIYYLKVPL